MKIIRLYSENVKRLRAVEILPKSNIVEIAGNNAQGKSSILDSIVYALGGKESIPSKPIREGQSKASIILETEEYIITRHWTSDEKSYLKVTTRDGLQATSPQTMLDGIVGKISFDPLEFTRMDSKAQDELLRDMVGLDTTDLEQQKASLYEMRTVVNREVKRLQVFRNELGNPRYDLPSEEISADSVMQEIDNMLERNKEKTSIQQELNTHKSYLIGLDKDIERYEDEIKKLQQKLEEFKSARLAKATQVKQLEVKLSQTETEDTFALQGELKEIEEKNKLIRRNQQISTAQNQLDDKQMESNDYTQQINDIDVEIQRRIAESKFPLEGLSLGEQGIEYNNIPIKQASQAEQIKISLAISAALNPTMRVVLIREGSLLDKQSMIAVRDWAIDKDYQVWVERVEPGSENAIIIEDGGVVA